MTQVFKNAKSFFSCPKFQWSDNFIIFFFELLFMLNSQAAFPYFGIVAIDKVAPQHD